MKKPCSAKILRRLSCASVLGITSLVLPALGDLTLHYNFESLTDPLNESDPVPNLGSAASEGSLVNVGKLSLNAGPVVVNVASTQYSLGKTLDFNSIDAETTSAGHVDTLLDPDTLGMVNGPTWNRDYTAMAWVNFRSTTGDNMVFGQTAAENSLHLGSRNGFFHSGHWGDDIGPDQGVNVTTPVNAWRHVAWVNQGQSQSIFMDGVLIVGPGATGANAANGGSSIVIGTFVNNGSFVGGIDEVKIFGDQALTAEQIRAEMTAGLPVYTLAALTHSELTPQGYRFRLTDTATSQVNVSTVQLQIDGGNVTPVVTKEGGVTTVAYVPPAQPDPGSVHTYTLAARDQANNNVGSASTLRAPYFPTSLPGPAGSPGRWGVREYRPGFAFSASSLEAVMMALSGLPATDPEDGTITEATSVPVINHSDPDAAGSLGNFNNELPFIGDQPGVPEDNFALLAKTQLTITDATQDYTFSIHSDDGFGLRITGGPAGNTSRFVASYGNGSIDASDPQALLHVLPTGDSTTRGVYRFSAPGTYEVTFVFYEIGGGAFTELAWAPGHHRMDRDAHWTLVGSPNDPEVTAVPFRPRWLEELPGPQGGAGTWGIRTYLAADAVDNLTQTMDFLRNTARTPEDGDGLTEDVFRNILNATDPNAAGVVGNLPADEPFPGDTGADDDRVVTVAKGRIQVDEAGPYTFSARGDDGFFFRIKAVSGPHPSFKRVTRSNEADANGRFEMSNPNEMFFEAGTGDSDTRGIIVLAAGLYDIEYVHWEGAGGFSYELAAAKGEFPHGGTGTPLWLPVGYAGGVSINGLTIAEPGWTVESSVALVVDDQNPAPATWLSADGEAAIDATLANPSAPAAKTSVWNSINFNDPQSGGPGSIAGDVPWPLNTSADDNYFAMRATANLTITTEGDYYLGFQGDDGGNLSIRGSGSTPNPSFDAIVETATTAAVIDEDGLGGALNRLNTDVPTGNSRTVGRIHLVPGTYQLRALMFEIGGGAFWEVFGGDAYAPPFLPTYPLLARGGAPAVVQPAGLRLVDPEAGTAPPLVLTNFSFNPATGAFSLTVASTPGSNYALDYTTGMQPAGTPPSAAKWTVAPGFASVPATGASTTISGNISALLSANGGLLPNGTVCFFRVRAL